MYVRILILQGRGGGGAGSEGYVKKRKEGGTSLRHTPRWLATSGEKFSDPPSPVCFCWGKSCWELGRVNVASPYFFPRLSVTVGMRVFTPGKSSFEQGFSSLRPPARTENSRWPSSFHLCRLVSHLS